MFINPDCYYAGARAAVVRSVSGDAKGNRNQRVAGVAWTNSSYACVRRRESFEPPRAFIFPAAFRRYSPRFCFQRIRDAAGDIASALNRWSNGLRRSNAAGQLFRPDLENGCFVEGVAHL